jgi:hypothetical protein
VTKSNIAEVAQQMKAANKYLMEETREETKYVMLEANATNTSGGKRK